MALGDAVTNYKQNREIKVITGRTKNKKDFFFVVQLVIKNFILSVWEILVHVGVSSLFANGSHHVQRNSHSSYHSLRRAYIECAPI